MLRRKPSKIDVKVEDRDELEEALRSRHQRSTAAAANSSSSLSPSSAAAAAVSSSTSATSFLQSLLLKKAALDPAEKAHALGIPHNN